MNGQFKCARGIAAGVVGLLALAESGASYGGIIYDSESYNYENIVVHSVVTQNTSGWDYLLYSQMRHMSRAVGPGYMFPWSSYLTVEIEPDVIYVLTDLTVIQNATPGLHQGMGQHGWRYFGMQFWFAEETDSETFVYQP